MWWLLGALAFNLLFTARTMAPAFGPREAVQDDALQHVFWMLRYRDPELFQDDLFADYFQSLAPPGYTAVYWTLAQVIDPLLASKLLPPLLGSATAAFTFLLVRRLYPSPLAPFLATVLHSWYVWQHDDLPSATPRAFLLPTLVALLWALASGRQALGVALTGVAALLYPIGGVLGVALLGSRLVCVERRGRQRWPTFNRRRSDWLATLTAAVIVGLVLMPEVLAATPYGPIVSAAEARTMPEFSRRGRNAFFVQDAYRFWLESYRSGLNLRVTDALFKDLPVLFELAALAALLPLQLAFRRRLPYARLVDGRLAILGQVLAASFGLFALAHLLLFQLYLPARYVQWSVPLVLAIAAGLALAIVCHELAAGVRSAHSGRLAAGLALLLAAGLALYPARYDDAFAVDAHPAVTAYLRDQPKGVLVAAAPGHADVIPALTGRRVLASHEFALAYHLGYYREVRQRVEDLIAAYYDEGPRRARVLVDRYGVDFILVSHTAFDALTFRQAWGLQFEPFTETIGARLTRRRRYALQDLARDCAVVDDGAVALVPVSCLADARERACAALATPGDG